MIYIGIDPGQTGAMAIIRDDGYIYVYDYEDQEGVKELKALAFSFSPSNGIFAALEKVHAMPGKGPKKRQGVSSTFKFGANFGEWKGRLEILEIPFDYVTPQKWQKVIFDSMPRGGDRKAMSLDRARRLFPTMADQLKRKKDHGRADALLIAEYCRRTQKGGEK